MAVVVGRVCRMLVVDGGRAVVVVLVVLFVVVVARVVDRMDTGVWIVAVETRTCQVLGAAVM